MLFSGLRFVAIGALLMLPGVLGAGALKGWTVDQEPSEVPQQPVCCLIYGAAAPASPGPGFWPLSDRPSPMQWYSRGRQSSRMGMESSWNPQSSNLVAHWSPVNTIKAWVLPRDGDFTRLEPGTLALEYVRALWGILMCRQGWEPLPLMVKCNRLISVFPQPGT